MSTPILTLTELAAAQSQPHLIVNDNVRALEAIAAGVVQTVGDNSPPGSPADGELYVVGTSPTGDWSGKAKKLALYVGTDWVFFTPLTEQAVRNVDDGKTYRYTGSAWAEVAAAAVPYYQQVACSDLASAITTGTTKAYFRMPAAVTLTSVRASLSTASTSGAVTIDVNKGGSTIFSTALTIDANEKTSVSAATPAVLSTTALADDDEITVDIDGAGTGAKGLIVTLIGTLT